jgi:hypothetical protein
MKYNSHIIHCVLWQDCKSYVQMLRQRSWMLVDSSLPVLLIIRVAVKCLFWLLFLMKILYWQRKEPYLGRRYFGWKGAPPCTLFCSCSEQGIVCKSWKYYINTYKIWIICSFYPIIQILYLLFLTKEYNGFDQPIARKQLCEHGSTRNNRGSCVFCRSDWRAIRLAG